MIADCPAAIVQQASLPGGPSDVPWISASHKLAGVVFGVAPGASVLELPVGGVWPDGRNAKILWVPRQRGAGRTLTIFGVGYRQTVGSVSGGGFPSIVALPHEGCWVLGLSTGKLHASVVVHAVTP
jgi:hypothetical protein